MGLQESIRCSFEILRNGVETGNGLHTSIVCSLPRSSIRSASCLRQRLFGEWKHTTDVRRTRRKWRSRNKGLVTLSLSRATRLATTRIGIPVRVSLGETICQRLQEGDYLVFLMIRQAELTDRHVYGGRDLGPGPAVNFFGFSCGTMPGSDIEHKVVPRVVEVNELFQTLDIAVVEELLLEVGPRRFSSRALVRCHSHTAR